MPDPSPTIIQSTIQRMNAQAKEKAENTAREHISAILFHKREIARLQAEIVKSQKALSEIVYTEITETDLLA